MIRIRIRRRDGITQRYRVRPKLRIEDYNVWMSLHDYMTDELLAHSLTSKFREVSRNYADELVRRHRLHSQRNIMVAQIRHRPRPRNSWAQIKEEQEYESEMRKAKKNNERSTKRAPKTKIDPNIEKWFMGAGKPRPKPLFKKPKVLTPKQIEKEEARRQKQWDEHLAREEKKRDKMRKDYERLQDQIEKVREQERIASEQRLKELEAKAEKERKKKLAEESQ